MSRATLGVPTYDSSSAEWAWQPAAMPYPQLLPNPPGRVSVERGPKRVTFIGYFSGRVY